jgi:amino acid transporter
MGSEAKNPKQNLPRAVMGVLAIVTVLYVLASLALVGMQNYLGESRPVLSPVYPLMSALLPPSLPSTEYVQTEINLDVGYSAAFEAVGQNGAARMIAAGVKSVERHLWSTVDAYTDSHPFMPSSPLLQARSLHSLSWS